MSRPPLPQPVVQRAALGFSRSLAQWWQLLNAGAQLLLLAGERGSYRGGQWPRVAQQIVRAALPQLWWFMLLAALATLVITRIVVVTAQSYGLSRYALEMVIRVLVLELIPLAATFFVAIRYALPAGADLAVMRAQGHFEALRARGIDPARQELVPRVVGGIFAVAMLAGAAGVTALVLAYLVVHGFSPWGLAGYVRTVGHVLNPAVALVFGLKTLFFSLAVALIPPASAMAGTARRGRSGAELQGLFRMLAAMVLVELASLMVNYS